MDLLAGWDRVRRNLVGTFFLQARAALLEAEVQQPPDIILLQQTYSLPVTELEREYRELAELDDSLDKARQEYGKKQKEFALRWELCSEKNDSLHTFFEGFNNYFKASKAKHDADKSLNAKLDYELEQKSREVRRLQKQLARMKSLKVELESRLDVCTSYKDFMQSVVDESQGEFENIGQVMKRYEELAGIRDSFVTKIIEQVASAFELEKELREMAQEKKMEEVAGSSYVSEMEKYRSQLQVSNWRRHDNLLALKDGLKRHLLMTHIPERAIYNIYLNLCQEMEQEPELEEHEFQEQLKFIQKFLKELVKVSRRTKQFFECPSDVPLVSDVGKKRSK